MVVHDEDVFDELDDFGVEAVGGGFECFIVGELDAVGGEALFDEVEVDFEPLGSTAEGLAAEADAGEVALDFLLGEGDLIGRFEDLLVLLEDGVEGHGGGAVGDGDLLEGLPGAVELDAGCSEGFGGFLQIYVHAGAEGLERGFLGVAEGGVVGVFDHPGVLGGLA